MATGRSAACLAVLAMAGPASAEPWQLDLDGACADPAAFRARVATEQVHPGDAPGVAIRVALTAASGAGWHARVELRTAEHATASRELDGESCSAVSDAAILVVAQLLDGVAPPPPPPPAPRRELAAIAEEPAPPPRPPAAPVSIQLAASAGADHGSLPATTIGGRGELAIGWRGVALALGAARWRQVETAGADGIGLEAHAWQAFAEARLRVAPRLEVGAQLEIGVLSARGLGVVTERSGDAALLALGGAARGPIVRWGPVDLIWAAQVLVPLERPELIVDGTARFRPGVTFRGFVGVTWRLFDGTRGRWP